jgi:hypothetical protein
MDSSNIFADTFDTDVLINIFGNATEREANAVLPQDMVEKIESDPRYWKVRTETLLLRELKPRNINWKNVHENLLRTESSIVKLSGEGDSNSVSVLLEAKVDPTIKNNSAVLLASANNGVEVVKLLMEDERVDPSYVHNWAIRKASRNGNSEVEKLLLADRRVDPSCDENKPIKAGSRSGYIEVVKLLLADRRVDPTAEGNVAIIMASAENSLTLPSWRFLATSVVLPSCLASMAS